MPMSRRMPRAGFISLEQADRWRAAGASESSGASGPEMLLNLATQPGEGGSSFSAQVAVDAEARQPLLRKAGAQ